MAISKIKVNTSTLKKDAESVSRALNDIKKKIKMMESSVNVLNGMWTGDANAAFNQAFQDDIRGLNYICDNIQSIINYEEKARSEYDSCEQNVFDIIDNITV